MGDCINRVGGMVGKIDMVDFFVHVLYLEKPEKINGICGSVFMRHPRLLYFCSNINGNDPKLHLT